jgi:glycosyltransferase involved in cell wall biosynthesis
MKKTVAFFLGTYEDWGGASRALLNFIRVLDRDRFRSIVFLTRTGNLSASLTQEGIEWRIWDIHDSRKNFFGYARDVWRAYRLFRDLEIDLIHMNYGCLGWKPAELPAARFAGVPVLMHLHITTQEPSTFIRYAKALVAVSDYVAEHSQTGNIPIHTVHNISYLARFTGGRDIRQDLGYDANKVLIVYMGQMIREKGIEMLIEAFRKLPGDQLRLLLAGGIRKSSGAYTLNEVQLLVSQDERISYLGFREDAENLYRTADIMVMPSQWEEPCAMILFEAAAAGRPLVATRTGGTAEILRDGETGFVVERSDINGLADRMRRLAEDPSLRHRMGARAAEVAREEYARGPIEKMQRLYDRLLESSP